MDVVVDQPAVVVGVIVGPVWHHAIPHHVVVIDSCGCLLLPGSVSIPLHSGVCVPGHMPHVRDPGSRLPAQCRGTQRIFGILIVPQVNHVVMRRVTGVGRQHLPRQTIDSQMTRDRNSAPTAVMPDLIYQERLRLDVFRKLEHDLLVCPNEVAGSLLLILSFLLVVLLLLLAGVVGRQCLDVEPLSFAHRIFFFRSLGNDVSRTLGVINVRHRDAPVGHRTFSNSISERESRVI